MCSEREMRERESCLEVNRLEMLRGTEGERRPSADPDLAVKRYQRPAAGAPPPPPSELRPLPVLRRTVEHLLRLWSARPDVPTLNRCIFISDRLRAVQQDLTVQQLHCGALLARVVRFHAYMELAFAGMARAAEQGYSEVHNRSMLCNALISALERPAELPTSLYSELLSYFIVLHADQPQALLAELMRAPPPVRASAAVARSLRLACGVGRDDTVALARALAEAPLLELACALRLLPGARGLLLAQCNMAYLAREEVPLSSLSRRLWLPEPAEVMPDPDHADPMERLADALADAQLQAVGGGGEGAGGAGGGGGGGGAGLTEAGRCAVAHGLVVEPGSSVLRFHEPKFTPALEKPMEPPLRQPTFRSVASWQRRRAQEQQLGTGEARAERGDDGWLWRMLSAGVDPGRPEG